MSVSLRHYAFVVLILLVLGGCAADDRAQLKSTPATSRDTPVHAGAIQPYPIKNPLLATVIGTPQRLRADLPKNANVSLRTLAPLVDRETPPTLRYARPLQYLLAAQDKPAPLVFVIAGTGATATSGKCVLLARALYAVGYSVACLPSPTTVTFMLGAAEHPVPGRMPADVSDLYRMMTAIRHDLASELDITGYSLAGVSLGATEAAFLAHRDASVHEFGFQHVLLLNPAVNLWDSVKRMDALLEHNLPGGTRNLPRFLAGVLGDINQVYAHNHGLQFNAGTLFKAYAKSPHSKRQTAALIGIAFRLSLADMAYAADVLTNSGVIVPRDLQPGPYASLDFYFQRSISMSYADYINKLLVPYWNRDGRHVSKSQLISEADLHRIARFLASDEDIDVFTNADDPILSRQEVGFLRATFGDRARIRPHGGHLGNLAYKKTIRALQDYFSS